MEPVDDGVWGWASAVVVAIVGALATTWAARRTAKPAAVSAEAAIQQQINDGFRSLMAARDAADAVRQAEWTRTVTELNRTIEALQGEVRNLTQHVESLETVMRKRGLAHVIPPRPKPRKVQPLVILEGGKP